MKLTRDELPKDSTEFVLTLPGSSDPEVIIYGYWDVNDINNYPIKFPYEWWPKDTTLGIGAKPRPKEHLEQNDKEKEEPEWILVRWDIYPSTWPVSDWEQTIKNTLQVLIDEGALVAWCATEWQIPYPPTLFRDHGSKNCVYAYLTKNGDFNCTAFPNEPFKPVSEKELKMLADLLYKDRPDWDEYVLKYYKDNPMSEW